MYTKIILTFPTTDVPINNQKEMNSFIHRNLGDNEFHDKFSDYAISSLQGGKLDKETMTLKFNNNPYFFVTDNNKDFYNALITGLVTKNETIFGMKFKELAVASYQLHPEYDIVQTVSPILLKVKRPDGTEWKLTVRDEGYIDELKKHCIKKLRNNGITDETFDLKIRKPELAKPKKIFVGDTFNWTSRLSLYVTGRKGTREKLYNLGFGNSTGSGFGFVRIYPF